MLNSLDEHQQALLRTLIDAARRTKDQQAGFNYRRMPPDDVPVFQHPGLRETLQASLADLAALADAGFVGHTAPIAGVGHIELTKDAFELVPPMAAKPPRPSAASVGSDYVDASRIEELLALAPRNFDLRRLVRLCEELNIVWAHGADHATGMLVRTIIDHVPPIFGVNSFGQVANNYPGARSFSELMRALDTAARKIIDGQLHTQVRQKEVLPTSTQVNFAPQVDALLAEIVRILR